MTKAIEPSEFVSNQLKILRKRANLTVKRLAELATYSEPLGWAMESGKRQVMPDTARRIAESVENPLFADLVEWLAGLDTYGDWYRDYLTIEKKSKSIRIYEMRLVPGILQTESYARVAISAIDQTYGEPQKKEITLRTKRKELLRNVPIHAILDEAVLCRPVGGLSVFIEQLESILHTPENVMLQVLPFTVETHPALDGSFSLLRLEGEPDCAQVDSRARDRIVEDPDEIRRTQLAFDRLCALALPPDQSSDMIKAYVRKHRDGAKLA